MRPRILIAVSGWLLGAVTATAGSLLAVSQLGLGPTGSTSQQLTITAVNSALAQEKTEAPASSTARPLHSTRPLRPAHKARAGHAARAVHPQAQAQPSHTASATPTPSPGTLLTSAGGSVLATCQAAGAYLLSWSPQQGFEALNIVRGPAATASVRFSSPSTAVTAQVTCSGGVPTLSQSSSGGSGGGDE